MNRFVRILLSGIAGIGVTVIGCICLRAQENLFAKYGNAVGTCFRKEAKNVAAKPVDLDTAGLAVIVRCAQPLAAMRTYVMTQMPDFTPKPDFWDREMEPGYLKQARQLIALERTK
jgi:hypothetical protein